MPGSASADFRFLFAKLYFGLSDKRMSRGNESLRIANREAEGGGSESRAKTERMLLSSYIETRTPDDQFLIPILR